MDRLITDFLGGVLGAGAFSVLVSVPRRALWASALVGGVAAVVFAAGTSLGLPGAAAAGFGALFAGVASEGIARTLRVPATVFLLPGLIPLVPGVTVYKAMSAFTQNRIQAGVAAGVETFLWAGAIAIGVGLAAAVFREFGRGQQVSPPPSV